MDDLSESTTVYTENIQFVETSAATIYTSLIRGLEQHVSEPLYPGDERRIYAEGLALQFVAVYSAVNDAARQTLLRYARGLVLDAIGERVLTPRLEGAAAAMTMRFSLAALRENNIIIPQGTKVTADSERYFATDAIAVLPAGSLYVDVPVSALEIGEAYNGYAAGQVTTLVDLIPYVAGVTNVTASAGGDDGEPFTAGGDDRYRERIRLALAARSTAGPAVAYEYWALTADAGIADAKAISEVETIRRRLYVEHGKAYKGGSHLRAETLRVYLPTGAGGYSDTPATSGVDYTATYLDDLLEITIADRHTGLSSVEIQIEQTMEGRVKVVPLLYGGEIPGGELLAKVLAVVSNDQIRPMSDLVTVEAPALVEYDIELKYYTNKTSEAAVVSNVEGSGGAIEQYTAWQCAALGRDINPDQLRKRILAPDWAENLTGASRVDVAAPTHMELSDTEVARWSGRLMISHEVVAEVI